MGAPLPLGLTASSLLSNGSDVYVTVRITIDKKSHIAPIASMPIGQSAPMMSMAPTTGLATVLTNDSDQMLKLRTITKYSYFESGEKWVKVLLPDLTGLKDHPAEKVKIEFPS